MTTKPRLSLAERLEKGEQDYLDWRAELEVEPGYAEDAAEIDAQFEQWWRLIERRKQFDLTYKRMAALLGITPRQAAKLYDHGYSLYSVDELRQYADILEDALGLPHL